MPYTYTPYCTECGAEGEYESLSSDKNGHGDFLIQTRCTSCGKPISVVKAELIPELKFTYKTELIKTADYFQRLTAEDLIEEMVALGRSYFEWEAAQETQGPVDRELVSATARCAAEIKRRLLLVETHLIVDSSDLSMDEAGILPTPAERECEQC